MALVDDQHMKVQLHRTGGFAGLAGTASLDSRDLDEAAAAEFRQLVTKLDLTALPTHADAAVVPDAFTYEIDIIVGKDHHRLALTDPDVPPEWRSLLTHVWSHGRHPRR
ncbi:MAG: protealysin inhibitor emfourin [Pseudonocardiaceae bacterium]